MYNDALCRKKMKKIEQQKEKSTRHDEKRLNKFTLHGETMSALREASLESHTTSDDEGCSPYRPISIYSTSPIAIAAEISPSEEGAAQASAVQDSSPLNLECKAVALDVCDADKKVNKKEQSPSADSLITVSLEIDLNNVSINGADSSIVLDTESDIGQPEETMSVLMTPEEIVETPRSEISGIPPHAPAVKGTENNLPLPMQCSSSLSSEHNAPVSENLLGLKTIGLNTLDARHPSEPGSFTQACETYPHPPAMAMGHRTVHGVVVPPILGIPRLSDFSPLRPPPELPKEKRNPPPAAPKPPGGAQSHVPKSLPVPRDFDAFVRLGQARRTQMEAQERQSREREADDLCFRPQLSQYAAQREPRTCVEFIDAAQAWEQRRLERISSAAAQAERAESAALHRASSLNVISDRIVKEMAANHRRVSVVEESQRHAAARQSRLNALREKYTPAFRPAITDLARRIRAPGPGDGAANDSRVYDRLTQRQASRNAAKAEAEERPPAQRRSSASIAMHLKEMAARDAARCEKVRRAAKRKAEAEEAAARIATRTRVNARSAVLAERHRQRENLKKEQSAAQNAESAQRIKSAMAQGHSPINHKLAYSPNKRRSTSRPTVPLISSDFEERNAQLLKRRELHCKARQREEDEMIARECTFHPVTNRAIGCSPVEHTSWSLGTPPRAAESITRSVEREGSLNHPNRMSRSKSVGSRCINVYAEDELSQQIQSLEEMITQWRQLEKEYSA